MTLSPLRVTIVGLNYVPEVTGIAPYTAGLARGLSERGHTVHVVTGYPHYPSWKVDDGYTGRKMDEVIDGVDVRRVRQYTPKILNNAKRVLLETSFGVGATAQGWHKPDVVVCVTPALIATAIALGRTRLQRSRPPVGVWVQDLYSRGLIETGTAEGRTARAAVEFESQTLRAADGVAVIHERFRRYTRETLRVDDSKIEVIRNWTHIKNGATRPREATRTLHGWKPHETVVLHAGNMGAKQGLENVIEAAKLSTRTHPTIRFVLLGDGNQRARLEAMSSPDINLQFLRPMDDYNFRSALDAADVLLVNELPGVTEMAVPSKLTTYFATGKPVLAATDSGSTTADEITEAKAGLHVPAGSPGRLVEAVAQLSANTELATALGRAGVDFYHSELNESSAIDHFEQWLRKIALNTTEAMR